MQLFEEVSNFNQELKLTRSGSFVDNMSLPIHRWFRYSAGFSAEWVEQLLKEWDISEAFRVLDPFAGSGTVSLTCDKIGVQSVSIEAHPFVARICNAKLSWTLCVEKAQKLYKKICDEATKHSGEMHYPDLIIRSFDEDILAVLDSYRKAWILYDDKSPESEFIWLGITSILRQCSKAGTAQWQYILPNKTKKKIMHPVHAFQNQIEMMLFDIRWMQRNVEKSKTTLVLGDARECASLVENKINAVITSPPYANNYDYADSLRFEMTFWGEINGWGDIHEKVRKKLIVSSSQHSSKERLNIENLLHNPIIKPILPELEEIVTDLAKIRENRGGKKHYHTMIAAYCCDIGKVIHNLRKICKRNSRMCWIIGDSAPYGVYCPIDKWIGEIALSAGFTSYQFEKIRDRNVKWKNRKHDIPLKEGRLWIYG